MGREPHNVLRQESLDEDESVTESLRNFGDDVY